MAEQSIVSQDMTLKRLLQDFYRVPDYQREYVWGEADPKGEGGEEVDQFLADIYTEYENVTKTDAPEYFIGTIVVCQSDDEPFELIDGQQRTTTSYLTLCAIRDALQELGERVPEELKNQIAATSVDWRGDTISRYRLDLQYEDAGGILARYADGESQAAARDGTRSIRNLGNAYDTVREFLQTTFEDDPAAIRRFYGYLINKVKIIRIETPTIAKALKIFETINDRGVGLDAMDLLKNLLFMNAKESEFGKLKELWKSLTDEIYRSGEKPLRFLRYYLLATFDVDSKLREDAIYDWFQKNEAATKHSSNPVGFAEWLLEAAKAYAQFARGNNPSGARENGIANTRLLGGKSIKQHFIVLLAGRHLPPAEFSQLADEIEKTLFVWLITGTAGKEYERRLVDAAHKLRALPPGRIDEFLEGTFIAERRALHRDFQRVIETLHSYDTRQFRLRYLIAKITQYVDLQAYGPSEARSNLTEYTSGGNDIEHILPDNGNDRAIEEFGEGGFDQEIIQRLGNLLLIEKSINRAIVNGPYSAKVTAYARSKFLLTRCQFSTEGQEIGTADKITKTVQGLESYTVWNAENVTARQKFLATLSTRVWGTAASG